ncbi:hypothetical protein DFJ73DRAFT_863969 [Zopfochytrium polystomum]|nr:hypothetical protein DFJ73DRAFT_863969 [Zopfochytrium polystomum]
MAAALALTAPALTLPRWTAALPSIAAWLGGIGGAIGGAIAWQPPSWLDGFLWAVPKKRTTHHKKRLRMTTKWLRPMQNIKPCPYCGEASLLHHICRKCLNRLDKVSLF